MVEMLFSLTAWILQTIILIFTGYLLWLALSGLRRFGRKAGKKRMDRWNRMPGQMLCILLVFILAAGLTLHPVVICSSSTDVKLTDEMRQEIVNLNNGLYSWRLPLIPVYIEVLEYDGENARVRTHYFVIGNTEMQVGRDGPSIVKPLG